MTQPGINLDQPVSTSMVNIDYQIYHAIEPLYSKGAVQSSCGGCSRQVHKIVYLAV